MGDVAEREERLIHVCEAANRDAGVLAIEREWDALGDQADQIEEPWEIAGTR